MQDELDIDLIYRTRTGASMQTFRLGAMGTYEIFFSMTIQSTCSTVDLSSLAASPQRRRGSKVRYVTKTCNTPLCGTFPLHGGQLTLTPTYCCQTSQCPPDQRTARVQPQGHR